MKYYRFLYKNKQILKANLVKFCLNILSSDNQTYLDTQFLKLSHLFKKYQILSIHNKGTGQL